MSTPRSGRRRDDRHEDTPRDVWLRVFFARLRDDTVQQPDPARERRDLALIASAARQHAHRADNGRMPWKQRAASLLTAATVKVAVVSTAAAATTGGLAASGNLPKPLQDAVATAAGSVGLELPRSDDAYLEILATPSSEPVETQEPVEPEPAPEPAPQREPEPEPQVQAAPSPTPTPTVKPSPSPTVDEDEVRVPVVERTVVDLEPVDECPTESESEAGEPAGEASPSPDPSSSASPSPRPSPSPSPSPSASPSASPTASPSPSPSPSASPSPSPAPTEEPGCAAEEDPSVEGAAASPSPSEDASRSDG